VCVFWFFFVHFVNEPRMMCMHACLHNANFFFFIHFVRKQVKAHVLFAIPTLTTIHDLKLLTNLSCDHHYNLSKFQSNP